MTKTILYILNFMALVMGAIALKENFVNGPLRGKNEVSKDENRELYYGGKESKYYSDSSYYDSESYYNSYSNSVDDTTGNYIEYYDDDNAPESRWKSVEKQVIAQAQTWYSTSPGNWTHKEWAFLIGIIITLVSLSVCIVSCCCGCCCGRESEEVKKRKEYDFDDYTSVDSYAKNSVAGIRTNSSDWDAKVDDATYDAIMRLRSKS